MEIDLDQLQHLVTKRTDLIEQMVGDSGYLPRTVIGVATFLLDNHGDLELLTSKQRVTFDRFLKPLLEHKRR